MNNLLRDYLLQTPSNLPLDMRTIRPGFYGLEMPETLSRCVIGAYFCLGTSTIYLSKLISSDLPLFPLVADNSSELM